MSRTQTKKNTQPGLLTVGAIHLKEESALLGFEPQKAQCASLARYLNLLMKWSRSMNLVGKTTWPDIFRDLAADSLHLDVFLRGLNLPERPLTLDLGAGAGLPGIPLRVLWSAGDYLLVELREKRAIFLRQAVSELALERVRVFHGRAEETATELARLGLTGAAGDTRADLLVSRAFLPWPKLLPLAAQLLAPTGRLVVLANEKPPIKAEELPGFTLEKVESYPAGSGDGRVRYFWSLSPSPAAPEIADK
jgi:Predicted S-adenosylmethionine-dependent methyltransferase involved in bacterial cell division